MQSHNLICSCILPHLECCSAATVLYTIAWPRVSLTSTCFSSIGGHWPPAGRTGTHISHTHVLCVLKNTRGLCTTKILWAKLPVAVLRNHITITSLGNLRPYNLTLAQMAAYGACIAIFQGMYVGHNTQQSTQAWCAACAASTKLKSHGLTTEEAVAYHVFCVLPPAALHGA